MKRFLLPLCALALSLPAAQAQTIPWLDLTALGGTKYTDSWTQLTQAHYGATGSFPGTGVAVSVGPDSASTYGALFNKTTASESGYLASAGFYAAFSETHLNVTSSAMAGLKTLVFQIDALTGSSGSLVADGDDIDVQAAPTLTLYNSGGGVIASNVAATFFTIDTYGTSDASGFDSNTNLDSYQWNLSAYSGVATFTVNWQVEYHTDLEGLELTQDNLATAFDLTTGAAPEPGTWALLVGGGGLLFLLGRGRRGAFARGA
jgi:hypothetical protein